MNSFAEHAIVAFKRLETENDKLRELVQEIGGVMGEFCEFEIDFGQFDDLRAVVVHDECGEHEDVWFYQFDELKAKNAKLQELVRDMHSSYIQMIDQYETSESTVIGEFSCSVAEEEAELNSTCDALRAKYASRMRELGIEVDA